MAGRTRIRTGAVEVEGLAELQRALRRMAPELADEVTKVNRELATDVRGKAAGKAAGLGGVAAHVAPSLGVTAGRTSAGVAGGGAGWPMFGGAEFGAINYPQFAPWRGNGPDAGYFVYPAIRDEAPHITDRYEAALDDITRRAGL